MSRRNLQKEGFSRSFGRREITGREKGSRPSSSGEKARDLREALREKPVEQIYGEGRGIEKPHGVKKGRKKGNLRKDQVQSTRTPGIKGVGERASSNMRGSEIPLPSEKGKKNNTTKGERDTIKR